MTGLNSLRPHYVFRHSLSTDDYGRWEEHGLGFGRDFGIDRLFKVEEIGSMASLRSERDRVIVLDWVGVMIWLDTKSELQFGGTYDEVVAGQPVSLKVVGYISPSGRGVMWVEDGVTPLDDPKT